MTIFILPSGTQTTLVLGAGDIPAAISGAAVASVKVNRPGGGPAPAPPPVGPGVGGSFPEEIPFPPTDAGPKTPRVNGRIQFAGYNWIVKDSGGEFPFDVTA